MNSTVRFLVMSILEILTELVKRMGHADLAARCEECQAEVRVNDKGGEKGG